MPRGRRPGTPKTGGRRIGSRNKVQKATRDIWAQLGGVDGRVYAEQLHALASAPHSDPHVRIKALSVIAPYVWKKLAERVELSGLDGGPIEVHDHFALPAPR